MGAEGALLVYWPVLGRGHLEKFWARVKNRKAQFSAPRGTFGGETIRPKSFSQKVRNFFAFCVLADRTLRGGKRQNTAVLVAFGLGQLREILGQGTKHAISEEKPKREKQTPFSSVRIPGLG